MDKLFLSAGELIVCEDGTTLSTVLGSCVAVCVFDPTSKIGGMNHYLLPEPVGDGTYKNPMMYGVNSIPALLKRFKEKGSKLEDLVVKILGGANENTNSYSAVHIENVAIARRIIQDFGLKIQGESTGGTKGRKVEFFTETGEVRFAFIGGEQTETEPKKTRVMVIDDSTAVRKVLKKLLESDPQIEVVQECASAAEAGQVIAQVKPDVLTLDLHMPGMDGLTYLQSVMSSHPLPVIIVTDCSMSEGDLVIRALEAGAFDYIQKPAFSQMSDLQAKLCNQVKTAHTDFQSGKFLVRFNKSRISSKGVLPISQFTEKSVKNGAILIGASTGGTEAIKAILTQFPEKIPPILIAQHMPPGFTQNFADRLNQLCPFHVSEAKDREEVLPGRVYIAPGGRHMKVEERGGKLFTHITDSPEDLLFKPSVDVLFQSVVKIKKRPIIAALLTGMGDDGADGLLSLRKADYTTLIQDEDSCVVFGMPKCALERGAAQYVYSLSEIPKNIIRLLNLKS